MSAEITIYGRVYTNKIGSRCDFEVTFPRDDWDQMSDAERDEVMLDAMWDSGMVEWSYEAGELAP